MTPIWTLIVAVLCAAALIALAFFLGMREVSGNYQPNPFFSPSWSQKLKNRRNKLRYS